MAASSVQDIATASAPEPRRRSSLEPEPDSRHRLTSVITGSTETISGVIDTRHEVPPPDPRAFEKPRRACTPQSNCRPLPAPPPERLPDDRPTEPNKNVPERHERESNKHTTNEIKIPERYAPDTNKHVDNKHVERTDNRHDRPIDTRDKPPERPEYRQVPERYERPELNKNIERIDRPVDNKHVERQIETIRPERYDRQERHILDTRLTPDIRPERTNDRQDRNLDNRVPLDRHVDKENRNNEKQVPLLENRQSNPETTRGLNQKFSESRIGDRQSHGQERDRHIEFRHPPERPPDKPSDRSSFDRDKVENRAPPRQRSLPSTTSGGVDHHPTKSTTMPKFPSEETRDPQYENVAVEKNELAVGPKKINPLTHDKHGRKYGDNVSYENINLDYIARLVSEGYPKDIVVRALGITRNDLEMACDILHEFGAKVPNKC